MGHFFLKENKQQKETFSFNILSRIYSRLIEFSSNLALQRNWSLRQALSTGAKLLSANFQCKNHHGDLTGVETDPRVISFSPTPNHCLLSLAPPFQKQRRPCKCVQGAFTATRFLAHASSLGNIALAAQSKCSLRTIAW